MQSQDSADVDAATWLSSEYEAMVPLFQGMAALGPLTAENIAERRMMYSVFEPFRPVPSVVEQTIPGPTGAPDVGIYVINAGGANRPGILYMHGGGFVLGSPKAIMPRLQDMALALDCVIVAVAYRLAPETPFPWALEDNYAGLKWLYANAATLGVDRTRLAILGESAGGGHAAMLAITARDRGEVPILYQALVYPMLDDRIGSTRQTPPHIGRLGWRAADNRFGWSSLLGVPAGSAQVPAGSVPARTENLAGLPPAFIAVGALDLFVEEDIDYARRLIEVGVGAELHVYPGAPHGFDMLETETRRQFTTSLQTALKNAFAFAKRDRL